MRLVLKGLLIKAVLLNRFQSVYYYTIIISGHFLQSPHCIFGPLKIKYVEKKKNDKEI